MEKSYLLALADVDLKPLKQRLKSLDAFYNGIGYAIPFRHKEEAFRLCQAAGVKLFEQPLPENQSFESFHQFNKAIFFRDKAVDLEREIESLKEELRIRHLSNEEIENSEQVKNSSRGNLLIEQVHKLQEFQESIKKAENFQKALSLENKQPFNIQFINERVTNFFLDDALEMPRLVNFIDGTISKPLIRKGIVGMLVGAGGVGKTHALSQLAISIATGLDWLGKFPIEKPGNVFLGLGENADEDIHRLLRKTVKSMISNQTRKQTFFEKEPFKEGEKRLAVMSFTGANATFVHQGYPSAFYQSFLNELKIKEPEDGWSCIILDPISRFLGADAETDNAAATQFISLLERFSLELRGNPTVLFGHHMNKSGVSSTSTDQAAARGSSAITDGVRWQANLEKVRKTGVEDDYRDEDNAFEINQVRMRFVKSNFTPILPPQKLIKDELGCLHVLEESSRLKDLSSNFKRKQ